MRSLVLILCLVAAPIWAVEPREMLDDPVLEARAQALDDQLRCVRCRSENIASSGADWAADARVLVRELIAAGHTDREVLDFFVARYGDFVLMKPRAEGANLLLWLAGPLLLLSGGAIAVLYLRSRASPDPAQALDTQESARLRELMDD